MSPPCGRRQVAAPEETTFDFNWVAGEGDEYLEKLIEGQVIRAFLIRQGRIYLRSIELPVSLKPLS